MSKTKQKTSREIIHLIGENKRLQKQVKRLTRMLEKYNWLELPIEKDLDVVEPILPKKLICGECHRGELEVMDIIGRVYTTCPICGHRERVDNKNG